MKKIILLFFLIGFFISFVNAQCECDNCPLIIPEQGAVVSQLTVSNSTNPFIGQNGQRLSALRLNLRHDAIPQLTIRLRPPGNTTFVTITLGLGTQVIPNVTFEICLLHCDESGSPDLGINNIFSWNNPWEANTTYTGSYYPWVGCFNFPEGTSVNGVWTLEFEDNTAGGGGELLGWSLEFLDNSGSDCITTCTQSLCQANGGNINPLSQSFCEGSPGLNFNIPPDFENNTPDPALYDYYYVITDAAGAILAYLPTPNLTAFPPGTYNICGLSVLSTDFPSLPTAGVGNNINDIQDGIDNQLYCADLSVGCRTVIIQAGAGAPGIAGPDTVCVNQLVTFELVGLDVSAWTQTSVTGPFSTFIGNNLPFIQVSWAPGPPTRTICANYNNGCISGTICKEVTVISPTPISINGPTTACAGQITEYTLAPAVDWDITVIGGDIISQNQTSFQIEWFENGGNNSVTVQYVGPCGTTGPVTLLITLTTLELPITLNSPDVLCLLGQGQSSIPANPLITNYIWSGTGITILSGQGTNSVQYTAAISGEVEICLEVESSCGNQGPICETISVEEPISPGIIGPAEACLGEVLTFTLEGLTEDQWVSNAISGVFEIVGFNFPTLTVAFASGSSLTEEICVNFLSFCGGQEQICIPISLIQPGIIQVLGPQLICEGQSLIYDITPPLPVGSSFQLEVNGGNLVSQSDNQFEVIWDNLQVGGPFTITITVDDVTCGLQDPISFEVQIFEASPLSIDTPNELCEGSVGTALANLDNAFSNYNWSGVGVTIVGGQGSNGPVSFTTEGAGVVQICVQAESVCGLIEPVCAEITLQAPTAPIIDPVDPSCSLDFVLSSDGSLSSISNWTQISGPSPATITSPNTPVTTVIVTTPGTYIFEYTEDDGICVNTNAIEVEVLSAPIVEIEAIVCDGGAYQVQLNIIGGAGAFSVNGEPIFGSIFISDFFSSGDSYEFIVTDNNNCTNLISGSFTCPCVADAGTMSGTTLNACISSGEVVVGNANNDAALDVNDIGVYVLHDNPGAVLGTIFATNEDGIFSFVPGLIPGQIYYISFVVGLELNNSFDPNDPCLSVSIGQPVVFYEDPEIVLESIGPFCDNNGVLTASVSLDVSNLIWEVVDGPGSAVIQNPSLPTTAVSFSDEGIYSFVLTASNLACTVSETFSVQLLPSLSIDNQSINCLDLENYILSFSIIGSGLNYTVDLPGTLNGNEFTSVPLDPSLSYLVTITDENGCTASANIGPINCSCGNFVGTMSNVLLQACASANGEVTATYNQNGSPLPTDIGVFILHDSNGSTLGNIIASNDTGTFSFQIGMNAGQTYYISYVIGSELNGNIDLEDPCLQVSVGQPVIWERDPEFELPSDTMICFGDRVIDFPNNNGGLFTILEDETDIDFDFQSDPGSLLLNPNSPGSVLLAYEETNGSCTRRDSIRITFWELPVVDLIEINCLGDFYRVELTISGGLAPYEVNGMIVNDAVFISDPIPANTPFVIRILDGRGCESDQITVNPNCDCESNAGQISNPFLLLCEQEDINLNDINLTDLNIPAGFELFFFLTDNPIWDPANILIQNQGSLLAWSDDLLLETNYYLFAVVTGITGDGLPDFSDACLASSNVLLVRWRENLEVAIAGSLEACVGTEVFITVEAIGTLPATVVLSNNLGEEIQVVLNAILTEVSYIVSSPGQIIWEITRIESICDAATAGNFLVNGIEQESITALDPPELCNSSIFGSILDLNGLLPDGTQGVWTFNGLVVDNGLFDADGRVPGVYELVFSTEGFLEPCPDISIDIFITVNACNCPELDLPDNVRFCAAEGLIELDELFSINVAGEWSGTVIAGSGELVLLPGNVVDISGLDGFFQLRFTLSAEFPEECAGTDEVILEVERALEAGVSVFDYSICPLGDEFVSLDDVLIGADPGGTWLDRQGFVVSGIIPRNSLVSGSNLFTYQITGDLCPSVQSTVELILVDSILINTSISQAVCPDEESSVTIEFPSEATNWTVLLNNEPRAGEFFFLSPGVNTLQIADSLGCASELLEIDITVPISITADLGADLNVGFGSRTRLDLSTNLGDEEISAITWLSSGVLIQSGGNTLELVVVEDQTIQVILVTVQGCTASAEINIAVAQAPVYIPNAFYPGSANVANQRFGPLSPQGILSIESFQIFDRWGNKVWDVSAIEEINESVFWDGTFKGREAAEGVYVYKLVYTNSQRRSVTTSGEVLLLK